MLQFYRQLSSSPRLLLSFLLFSCFCNSTALGQASISTNQVVPDPLNLDAVSEAILARLQASTEGVSTANQEQLRKLIDSPKSGLVWIDGNTINSSFAYKTFSNARLAAVRKLLELRSLNGKELWEEVNSAKSDAFRTRTPSHPISPTMLPVFDMRKIFEEIDEALEIGWTYRARILLTMLEPGLQWRATSTKPTSMRALPSLSWFEVYRRLEAIELDQETRSQRFIELVVESTSSRIQDDELRKSWLAELWCRYLFCSYLERDIDRFQVESMIVIKSFGDQSIGLGKQSNIDQRRSDGLLVRDLVGQWQANLDERSALDVSATMTHASPSIADFDELVWEYSFAAPQFETATIFVPGYPSGPTAVFADGKLDKLLVRQDNKLFGWDRSSNKIWPDAFKNGRGFTSAYGSLPLAVAEQLELGSVTSNDRAMYSLVDSTSRSSASSSALQASWLVGIDLKRDGSLIGASPIAYESLLQQFSSASVLASGNFVGTPLASGDRLYVLAASTTSSEQFQVICFDSRTLKPLWLSNQFGNDRSRGGSKALSLPCLLEQQGMLFVINGRGSLCALDTSAGELMYQINYVESLNREFRGPINPLRKSTLFPHRDLIICCPSDVESVFAFSRNDGQIRWVLDADSARRSTQICGVVENSLIGLGDRLAWIDAETGNVKKVIELPYSDRLVNGAVQLENSMLLWSNGRTICQLDLTNNHGTNADRRLERESILRLPVVFDEPFAFQIVDSHLTVVTPNSWRIFK